MRRFPHHTPAGRAAATTGATTALCSPQPQGPRRHFANALHKPSSAPRQCFWEPPSARRPSTHELAPQLGPDALGLRLRGVDGVAQGPQVVVDRQALPHVEGAGAEMAERGLLHRRAEPRLQLGIPRGVHAVVLQPPGLPWGQRDTRYPSELRPSLGCAPLQPREGMQAEMSAPGRSAPQGYAGWVLPHTGFRGHGSATSPTSPCPQSAELHSACPTLVLPNLVHQHPTCQCSVPKSPQQESTTYSEHSDQSQGRQALV